MCIRDSAKSIYQQAINTHRSGDRDRLLVSSYAYAVSEENASGHRIVTAPTCGASGVLPAVMYYCYKQLNISKKEIIKALAVAGVFGNVIKANATISGADGGCQAEIGSACSMAAAGYGWILELNNNLIQYAAEMGLEHNLGLTCDPVSYTHLAHVPKGGPAGGDGGKGGSVIFEATTSLSTLLDLKYNRLYKAPSGQNGMAKKMHGKDAIDTLIKVPVGTVIINEETNKIMADLTEDKQRVVIAKGGRGGRGNARFATSRNPAPQICERGEPGEKFDLQCELKLLADVGLVGFPSVGKSTLLSVVSRARPEIADYHFTTIVPNLGVVQVKDCLLYTS